MTIVFISHNDFINMYKRASFINKKLKGKCDFIFAYDNELLEDEKKILLKNEDRFPLYYHKNKGKLLTLIEVSKIVKTPFFKVIDHDDSIYFKGLFKLCKKINKIDEKTFLTHDGSKINASNFFWGKDIKNEIFAKMAIYSSYDVKHWFKVPNARAIFNTNILRLLSNVKFFDQKYYNDNLLALFLQYSLENSENIKVKFYIQNHGYGQTSFSNTDFKLKAKSLLNMYKNLNMLKDLGFKFNLNNVDKEKLLITEIEQCKQFEKHGINIKGDVIKEIRKMYGQ